MDGPAEEDVLEESEEDQVDTEGGPSEDLVDTQEEQPEFEVEVESA